MPTIIKYLFDSIRLYFMHLTSYLAFLSVGHNPLLDILSLSSMGCFLTRLEHTYCWEALTMDRCRLRADHRAPELRGSKFELIYAFLQQLVIERKTK